MNFNDRGWKYSGIGVATIAIFAVILSFSKCAVDSYKAQAEPNGPAAPSGLSAVEVSRHGEPVPKALSPAELEQAAWSERMYKKLNDDILSGRRAPNKMGVYEPEATGWTVIQGAPPFDPKPEAQATTFDPAEAAHEVAPEELPVTVAVLPPIDSSRFTYIIGGGGICSDCCVDEVKPPPVASVPEPSAIYLLGTGLITLFWTKRKKFV